MSIPITIQEEVKNLEETLEYILRDFERRTGYKVNLIETERSFVEMREGYADMPSVKVILTEG